jgi:hypothetical protein
MKKNILITLMIGWLIWGTNGAVADVNFKSIVCTEQSAERADTLTLKFDELNKKYTFELRSNRGNLDVLKSISNFCTNFKAVSAIKGEFKREQCRVDGGLFLHCDTHKFGVDSFYTQSGNSDPSSWKKSPGRITKLRIHTQDDGLAKVILEETIPNSQKFGTEFFYKVSQCEVH